MDKEALLRQLASEDRERPEPDSPCLTDAQLTALRSGALTEGERGPLEAHLAGCDLCLDRAATFDQAAPRLSEGSMARILAETRPARAPWWSRAWIGGMVALAAALALVLILPGSPTEPIPPYALTLSGSTALSRGSEPAAEAVWGEDSAFVVRLTPPDALTGGAGARGAGFDAAVYVGREGGALSHKVAPAERLTDPQTGLVELRYEARLLFTEGEGEYQVGVLLAPPDAPTPATLAGVGPTLPDGARLLTARARYTPGPALER